MFGKEKGENEKMPTPDFDLEESLKANPHKKKELIATMRGRVDYLKELMRKGQGAENFEKVAVLLNGYQAFLKVVDRI